MNKILVSKNKISCDNHAVNISRNKITFTSDGEYIVIYQDDYDYEITFIVDYDVKLIETSFDRVLNINNRYVVNNKLRVFKFYNNKSVLEHINIDLCSEKAEIDYHFSNICKVEERYTVDINHKAKNTYSNIVNKSIALKNSVLKFIINSNVGKEYTGSVLEQNTRILAMGECDASISPNMYIDLDDVSAKHGSVIGTFKDDDVFYLMSRGISYNDAIKLLIKGYIMGNMEVDVDTRMMIMEIIDTYWR